MKNLYRNAAWLYDLERDNDILTADIPFYIEYAQKQNGEILELGCGTGRVALALAKEGFNITGLDLSQQMLDVFKAKLENPSLSGKVDLVHGDIADFSLGRKFALITAPFRVFQCLTKDNDVANSLKCIREHLTDDGVFIVNVFNPIIPQNESWENWSSPEEITDFEGVDKKTGAHIIRKHCKERIDETNQIIYPYFVHEVTYPNGGTERLVDHLQLKYYYRPQLHAAVETAGLIITEEFSWYDKSPPGGREIILVCKK